MAGLHLAELHSQAVDYPKTGIPAEWSHAKYSPKTWPHFMEKHNSYYTPKALGKLYTKVANANVDYVPSCDDQFDSRIAEKVDKNDEVRVVAKSIKAQYDVAVRRLLKQFRIATEFELFSGWAMSKPAIGSDYKRQEDLGHQYDSLKQRFREMCVEAAGASSGYQLDKLVAAMYGVTEEEVAKFLAEAEADGDDLEYSCRTMPLISFPWIFHWVLIKIATGPSYKTEETEDKKATVAKLHALETAAPQISMPAENVPENVSEIPQGSGEPAIQTPAPAPSPQKSQPKRNADDEMDLIDFTSDEEVKPEKSPDPIDEDDVLSPTSVKSFETALSELPAEIPAIREPAADRLLRLLDSDSEEY